MANESQYYDGRLYHVIIDPFLNRIRHFIRDAIPSGSSVLDIGSGTGSLCLLLSETCSRVVGIDHSPEMVRYADRRKAVGNYPNVDFYLTDAVNASSIKSHSFEYATISMVLHEMPRETRMELLSGVAEKAESIIVAEYNTARLEKTMKPFVHLIERMAGRNHYRNFRSFCDDGGIDSLLRLARFKVNTVTTCLNDGIVIVHGNRDGARLASEQCEGIV